MSLTVFSMLLVIYAVVQVIWARAKPVDIFRGAGKSDILQLRNPKKNDTRVYNALYNFSRLKWIATDNDGNIVIPYTITGSYSFRDTAAIARAMSRIARNTCIRFRKRNRETDYIDIVNKPDEGCMTTSIVLHELMHVVGLWHEHQRFDRDDYIKVHYENIGQEYYDQFTKVQPFEATTYNVPYDYESVMHYKKDAFALPNKISMETKDPDYQDVIGNQHDASPTDYFKICEIYRCQTCMGILL